MFPISYEIAPEAPKLWSMRGDFKPVVANKEEVVRAHKEQSRTLFKLAIPQLLNEINIIGQPRQAAERFKYMILDPDLYRKLRKKADEGNELPLERQVERILRVADGENG